MFKYRLDTLWIGYFRFKFRSEIFFFLVISDLKKSISDLFSDQKVSFSWLFQIWKINDSDTSFAIYEFFFSW